MIKLIISFFYFLIKSLLKLESLYNKNQKNININKSCYGCKKKIKKELRTKKLKN